METEDGKSRKQIQPLLHRCHGEEHKVLSIAHETETISLMQGSVQGSGQVPWCLGAGGLVGFGTAGTMPKGTEDFFLGTTGAKNR